MPGTVTCPATPNRSASATQRHLASIMNLYPASGIMNMTIFFYNEYDHLQNTVGVLSGNLTKPEVFFHIAKHMLSKILHLLLQMYLDSIYFTTSHKSNWTMFSKVIIRSKIIIDILKCKLKFLVSK